MKLISCLMGLPSNMKMIDCLEISACKKVKTVEQIIAGLQECHKNEEGYEVRFSKRQYGRVEVLEVGIIGGGNLYVEQK